MTKAKPQKKKPQDLTLRNLRAMNKRVKSLECEIATLDANQILMNERLEKLEWRVGLLNHYSPTKRGRR